MNEQERTLTREFIANHAGVQIHDDEDLFASGHVNSLFAVQLVMWIERTFGTPVANDDLDFDNFRTISSISSFVARKRSAEVPGGGG
jgi:acyl carrier protein